MERNTIHHIHRAQQEQSGCSASEREQLMIRGQRLHDAAIFQALAALFGLLTGLGRGGKAKRAADSPRVNASKGPRHGWAA